jgi:hypothetical protein
VAASLTVDRLAAARGEPAPTTARWVADASAGGRLLVVEHGGQTLVPTFQLDKHGNVHDHLAPVLELLLGSDEPAWVVWTWLTSRTSLLSGEVPIGILTATNPRRALTAAERFIA